MNDGKFEIAVIRNSDNKRVEIPIQWKTALVKMSNGEAIPEDEPIFILRGRDVLAVQTLAYYLEISAEHGCNDYHQQKVSEAIERFTSYEIDHPDVMKTPSVTRGL
jgi:hypothetical protein